MMKCDDAQRGKVLAPVGPGFAYQIFWPPWPFRVLASCDPVPGLQRRPKAD